MLHIPTMLLGIFLIFLGFFLLIILPLATTLKHRKHGRILPPGPRRLPIIGNLHMLTTLPHRSLHNLAKNYGGIMSLWLGNIPAIVVSSPRAAELFLKTHDTIFASRPKSQASEYLSYSTTGMAFAAYGPYWRNVRKLCTLQLLSASKINSFAALRREEVRSLVQTVKKAAEAGEVVDVSKKVGELIADMSCRMILGTSREESYHLKELVHEGLCLMGAFNVADYLPCLEPFDLQGLTRKMKKLRNDIDKVLEKIIMEHEQVAREQQIHSRKDFVDVLLSLMNQPMNPEDEHVYIVGRTNIKGILLDMIVAAFDTSTVAIEWTISELLRNPKVMKNLQNELENVVGRDRIVEEKDLDKLIYLDMVLKESLRLHPVAPFLVPRESMKDITIDGYLIPKKSRILINTWAIGRDSSVWSENVEEFYPERFTNSDTDYRGHDFKLLPFGSGRRGCPGMQLGLTIVRYVVAQLVHCFDWELPCEMKAEDMDMTEKFGLSMGRANNLLAKPAYHLLPKTI